MGGGGGGLRVSALCSVPVVGFVCKDGGFGDLGLIWAFIVLCSFVNSVTFLATSEGF